MLLLMNLMAAIVLFTLLLVAMTSQKAENALSTVSFVKSVIYRRIGVRILFLEISWIYLVVSVELWFGLTIQNGFVYVVLVGMAGFIAIPIDLSTLKKRREPVDNLGFYLQSIECLFHKGPESQLLDALSGLREEAVTDIDARAALEQLSHRDDPLGELVRSHTSISE